MMNHLESSARINGIDLSEPDASSEQEIAPKIINNVDETKIIALTNEHSFIGESLVL